MAVRHTRYQGIFLGPLIPSHMEVAVMRNRTLVGLLIVCSYFLGAFVQGTMKIVSPGKTVRLVSVGLDPHDDRQLIFTIMTPDEKFIGHFRFPRRHCEFTPRMAPSTFRFVPEPRTKENPFGGHVEYFCQDGTRSAPIPSSPQRPPVLLPSPATPQRIIYACLEPNTRGFYSPASVAGERQPPAGRQRDKFRAGIFYVLIYRRLQMLA